MATKPTTRRNSIVQARLTHPDTGQVIDLGQFASMEGGAIGAESGSYADWDGTHRLEGNREREDITLRRAAGRHPNESYKLLDSLCGSARMEVSRVTTSPSGQVLPGAEVITYRGVLSRVELTEVDKSSNEAQEIVLTVSCDADLA